MDYSSYDGHISNQLLATSPAPATGSGGGPVPATGSTGCFDDRLWERESCKGQRFEVKYSMTFLSHQGFPHGGVNGGQFFPTVAYPWAHQGARCRGDLVVREGPMLDSRPLGWLYGGDQVRCLNTRLISTGGGHLTTLRLKVVVIRTSNHHDWVWDWMPHHHWTGWITGQFRPWRERPDRVFSFAIPGLESTVDFYRASPDAPPPPPPEYQ
jgi:hypothetical protein